MGYVLPWGNMSLLGRQGDHLAVRHASRYVGAQRWSQWIMGDFLPSDATLNRFFALHVIALPLVLLLLVVLHLAALHEVGSNNPDGVEIPSTARRAIKLGCADGWRRHHPVPSVLHGEGSGRALASS